jgi:hypothetical protein
MKKKNLMFWIFGLVLVVVLGVLIYFYWFWVPIKSLLLTIWATLLIAWIAANGAIKISFLEFIIGLVIWFIIIYILIFRYLVY